MTKITLTLPIKQTEANRILFLATMKFAKGNRTRAAEFLGLSIRGVRNNIQRWAVPTNDESGEIPEE